MPNEKELRKHRCCFTGHRPEKLHKPEEQIKKDLEKAILQAVDDGFVTFISGMARGVDIWAAEIVLRLRESNPQTIGFQTHDRVMPPQGGLQDWIPGAEEPFLLPRCLHSRIRL